jgi:hypothetical protein
MPVSVHPAQASATAERFPCGTEPLILVSPDKRVLSPPSDLFSLRCLTSPPVAASSSIISAETRRKSAPFRAGYFPLSRALSPPLQQSLRFLRHPLPPPPSPFLAVGFPPWGGTGGAYPVARWGVATGAAASFRPAGIDVTVASGAVWRSDPRTFWSRPPASWACSTSRILDGRSLALSLPVSARVDPDRGSQASAHCPRRLARRIAPSHCQVAAPR